MPIGLRTLELALTINWFNVVRFIAVHCHAIKRCNGIFQASIQLRETQRMRQETRSANDGRFLPAYDAVWAIPFYLTPASIERTIALGV